MFYIDEKVVGSIKRRGGLTLKRPLPECLIHWGLLPNIVFNINVNKNTVCVFSWKSVHFCNVPNIYFQCLKSRTKKNVKNLENKQT